MFPSGINSQPSIYYLISCTSGVRVSIAFIKMILILGEVLDLHTTARNINDIAIISLLVIYKSYLLLSNEL